MNNFSNLEFKDKFLYEQFNILACKGKNWLPDSYGHSTTQGKDQSHPKAKVYRKPVRQPAQEISIDDLLKTVDEIRKAG